VIAPAQERQLAWRRQQAPLIQPAAGEDEQMQELLLWAATVDRRPAADAANAAGDGHR
jgi:hypothetical protein